MFKEAPLSRLDRRPSGNPELYPRNENARTQIRIKSGKASVVLLLRKV